MAGERGVWGTVVVVVGVVVSVMVGEGEGHIRLTYPPARKYQFDFLDNVRTPFPCGMPPGLDGSRTMLKAGSIVDVHWHLSYPHKGGYFFEVRDENDTVKARYPDTGFLGSDDGTSLNQSVSLPGEACEQCTFRMVRQAQEWGKNYLFWSCSDVAILPEVEDRYQCSGHGTLVNGACVCDRLYKGDKCQFKEECDTDADCGSEGMCVDTKATSYPVHQCYCKHGWFGSRCHKRSTVTAIPSDMGVYSSRVLSTESDVTVYYRIVQDEVEVMLRAKTNSWMGFGWRPSGTTKTCQDFPDLGDDMYKMSEPEAEGKPEGVSEPKVEGEPLAEGEGYAKGENTTAEGEAHSEGYPEGEAKAEGDSSTAEVYPEGEHNSTSPEAEDHTATPEGTPEDSVKVEGDTYPEGKAEDSVKAEGDTYPEGKAEGSVKAEGDTYPEGKAEDSVKAEGDTYPEGKAEDSVKTEGDTYPEGKAEDSVKAEGDTYPEGKAEDSVKAEGDTYPEGKAEDSVKAEGDTYPEGKAEAEDGVKGEAEAYPEGEGSPEGEAESESHSDLHAMDCTDIVIGSARGGYSRIGDYYTRDRSTPVHDQYLGGDNSLTAGLVWEEGEHTVMVFRKKLRAQDVTDHSLDNEVTHVLWAVGQQRDGRGLYNHSPNSALETPNVSLPDFYRQDELKYHGHNGQRGAAAFNFYPDVTEAPEEEDCNRGACAAKTCGLDFAWAYDVSTDLITFNISAKYVASDQWIALGFSDNEQMANTDVIYGGVGTDGNPFVQDGWLYDQKPPRVDSQQDAQILSGGHADSRTSLVFTRRRSTGDPADLDLSECRYVFFAKKGGKIRDGGAITKHVEKPVISAAKVCFGVCQQLVTYATPLSVRFADVQYVPAYSDPLSAQFRQAATSLLPRLEAKFKQSLGKRFHKVVILAFRPGSLIVDFEVQTKFKGDVATEAVKQKVTSAAEALGTETIEGYGALELRDVGESYRVGDRVDAASPSSSGLTETEIIILAVVLALVLVAVLIGLCKFLEMRGARRLSKQPVMGSDSSGGSTKGKMTYGEFMATSSPPSSNGGDDYVLKTGPSGYPAFGNPGYQSAGYKLAP
ncbi:uncharacterized protein LOC143279906 [Babylonia areolata]|uniref:uncharacterized protein LOC143279906 n=1 Tax=Babylonia areolata TaxID=304850 RepID=UPI003FD43A5A